MSRAERGNGKLIFFKKQYMCWIVILILENTMSTPGISDSGPASPVPGPSGAPKKSLWSRFTPFRRGGPFSSFEEAVKTIDNLKDKALGVEQSSGSKKAIQELIRFNEHFSKLAKGGDETASQISQYIGSALVALGIERESPQKGVRETAAAITGKFTNGPIDKDLGDTLSRFFIDLKSNTAIPDHAKKKLVAEVLEGAFFACEREMRENSAGPSPKFYAESMPLINDAFRYGLEMVSKEAKNAMLARHKGVTDWFDQARASFYETIVPTRHEQASRLPQEKAVTEEALEAFRGSLPDNSTIKQRRVAEEWQKEFLKFAPDFWRKMTSEIQRAGPHYVDVNGESGVIPKGSPGQSDKEKFLQWCQLLEKSIEKVPEKEKPQWRAALAHLMLAAMADRFDQLAVTVHEGLAIGEEGGQFQFKGDLAKCSLVVDVENGTCTLQRTRDVSISPLDQAPIHRLLVTTDQKVSIRDPSSVVYGVEYGATRDLQGPMAEVVDQAKGLQDKLRSKEPITGEIIEAAEDFSTLCNQPRTDRNLVRSLALSLTHGVIRRCDEARADHPDHPTLEEYYTLISTLRHVANPLLPEDCDALLSQNPELASWLERGRALYATLKEKTTEEFSSRPTLRKKEMDAVHVDKLDEEKKRLVERWLPYFPDPDEVAHSITRGNEDTVTVNGRPVISSPLEHNDRLDSERFAVFCQVAETLFQKMSSCPGSEEDKKKAAATLVIASIMHNVPGEMVPGDIGISLGMDFHRVWGYAKAERTPQYVAAPEQRKFSFELKHAGSVADMRDPSIKTEFLLTSKAEVNLDDPEIAHWTFSWEPLAVPPSSTPNPSVQSPVPSPRPSLP